jgi:uncharacterized protein
MARKSEPEGAPDSPIAFQPVSNGETPPIPRLECDRRAEALFARIADEKARRLGMSRREFAQSACGMAAALSVFNQVYGCSREGGGKATPGTGGQGGGGGFTQDAGYDIPRDVSADQAAAANQDAAYSVDQSALEDQAQAQDAMSGPELIFDVQTHNEVATPPWMPSVCNNTSPNTCPSSWIRQIFADSDTSFACLSGFPSDTPALATRQKIREIVDQLSGSPRMVIHANVLASNPARLDRMEADAKMFPIAAWKIYPELQVDPNMGAGPFLERVRATGVKAVAAHRGLNGSGNYLENGSPRDMAVAAKAFSDINFLVYHSGWQSGLNEDHPFNPMEAAPRGVDRLIKAALDNGVAGKNLYAELGSTWYRLMREPAQAAHVLGKLLKYLGPDNIVWGTDCVLNGNPQEQIVAFRNFQIPVSMQAMYGYPALTPETKRKIFGLNAGRVYGLDLQAMHKKITADDISKIKLARRDDPRAVPIQRTRGPRTWREYFHFKRHEEQG